MIVKTKNFALNLSHNFHTVSIVWETDGDG